LAIDDKKDDHDVLHVKKDSSSDTHYYYSRAERLSLPSASKLHEKSGKKKRIRSSSVIIILDILLIVIAFILFRLFLFGPANEVTAHGYRFYLRQIVSENNIVVSVTAKKTDTSDLKLPTEAEVRFSLAPGNDSSRTVLALPEEAGAEHITRVRFPLTGEEKKIQALVILGTESFKLSLPIKK